MVPVGSARIDENGHATGGRAGDQTGKEVSTQAYYARYINPWRVFRFKDPAMGRRAAALMLAACNNKHVGYNQNSRRSLLFMLRKIGYDMVGLKDNVNTDCSALIEAICECLGIRLGEIRTWTEPKALLGSGYFIELKGFKYTHSSNYLQEGDILCTSRKGHTVMVVGHGPKAGVADVPVKVVAPVSPKESYLANWITATAPVNLRTGPGTGYKSRIVLPQGAALMYDGAVSGEWYAVMWRGKRHYLSAKFVTVEVHEKPIVDLSVYRVPKDWKTFSKWVSFVILRVGIRRLTSNGPIQIDAKFKVMAKVLNALGIPFAVYFYGRAKTVPGGVQEAQKSMEFAEAYNPVMYFYDVEAPTCTHDSVQAFGDYIEAKTGKPFGVYVGRMWDEVHMPEIRRKFTWCPYYVKGHSGIRCFGRKPSHPHDMQQNSPSAIYPGGDPRGCDNSFINDDPNTNGTGHDILWLRTGGKEGR